MPRGPMKPALVLLLCLAPTVASAQAPTLPAFPGLPAECVLALDDARLCGGSAPCVVEGQTLATGLPAGQPQATSRLGAALTATTHEAWSANGENWEPLPMPEREARLVSSNLHIWAARSGAETPTLRKRTAQGWGPTIAAPTPKPWRYQSGGCVMATLTEKRSEKDTVQNRTSVSVWNGGWTAPWHVDLPYPARVQLFPAHDGGLHVFSTVPGPKGQTVWYGRPGQQMKVVAGPVDLDGTGLQPSGHGVYMAHTQTETVAVLVSPGGMRRLNLQGGKSSVLFRSETRTHNNEKSDAVSEVKTQPIVVGVVGTEHDVRVVYRVHGRKVDFAVTRPDKATGRPGSRRQVGDTNTERVFVVDPLARKPRPHEVKVEGYAGEAVRIPGGPIWIVGSRKNGDATDLVVHILTTEKLGDTWRPAPFDYTAASTPSLHVSFDAERSLLDAGFQRWGTGTSTFKKGRMTVTSDSYEEWFSVPSLGLLRGQIGKGYLLETRMRLVPGSAAAAPGTPPNAGIRFGGPLGRAALRLTPRLLHFSFEGATTKIPLDCTQMHTLQVAVFANKAILYRGGIEVARLVRPTQAPPRTDAVHLVVGALGGSPGVTAEFDELKLTGLAR
jgi:hypothetical protein